MGRCADCRFLEVEEDIYGDDLRAFYGYPDSFDEEEHVPRIGYICGRSRMNPKAPDPDRTALAQDHEDYNAELWVKPDHGCTMFEPKEPT